MQTEINLDELVSATYLDENLVPEAIKNDPYEAEFWRLHQCFKILRIQVEHKEPEAIELTEIPIYKTLAETFAKIAEKKDLFMDHYTTFRTISESQIIKQNQARIDSLLPQINKKIPDELLTNILVVQKILVGLQERVSSLLQNPTMQHQILQQVLTRQNLDVLNAFLNLLEPGPDAAFNSAQSSIKMQMIIEALINLPQKMSISASFMSFLQAGDIEEISLPPYQQQEHQHPGFTFVNLVADQRKIQEIAEEYLGQKLEKLNAPGDQKLIADTQITLFLFRVSQKPDFREKLVQTCVKALKYKHLTEGSEKIQTQSLSDFTPEAIQYLRQSKNPQLAADILDILSIRLLRSSTRDAELKYYLSECEQANENVAEEVFEIENLSIYQMLKQVSHMRVAKNQSKEDVEMSAFEDQEDEWAFIVPNGFFKTDTALHPEVKARVQKLVRIFKSQIKKMPNSQERQSFILKLNAILFSLELKIVDIDSIDSDPQVLITGCPFSQILNQINRFSADLIYSQDQPSFARDYEVLIEKWIKQSKQPILTFEFGLPAPIELTRMQKATITAELINQLSDDVSLQYQQRVVFPNDFGARIIAGNLLKILQNEIIPLYQNQDFSDPATDLILTAFINLISSIIHNEPGMISQMLKPKEEEPAIINQLLLTLSLNAPKSQTYFYIQSDAFESIVYKLFSRLLVTEIGKTAVHENSYQIVLILIQGRRQNTDRVYYMGERKQLRGILIKEIYYDQVSKVKPIASSLRDEFKLVIGMIQAKSYSLNLQVEKFKKVAQDKNYKEEQAIRLYFITDRNDICELEDLLAIVNIQNRRSLAYQQREPTTSILPILKESNISKAILEQYQGILTSLESLCMFESQFISGLISLIRIIVDESYHAGHQDQIEITYILNRMKSTQKCFLDYINVYKANTIEDLTQKPDFVKLLQPVLLYNKIFLKKLGHQFSNKLGVFADWKEQIPQLMQFALLISQKNQQLIKDVVHEVPIAGFKFDLTELKKIEITKDLNSFIPWYDQIEKIMAKVQKYQKRAFVLNAKKDSFPFEFLKTVQFTSTQRHQRQINANSVIDTANGNHGAFGEQNAKLIKQLLIDSQDINAIIEKNAPIIYLMTSINQDFNLYGMYHIKFIQNNGVPKLCQIYKKLDELQDQLFADDNLNENVFAKATIIAQREVVTKMLMGVVSVSRRFELTYNKIDVKKETNNQFENLNHLLVNQYNQLFNEFLLWNKDDSEQKPIIVNQRKPNFDQVLESLVQAFAEKSWNVFEAGEAEIGRGRRPENASYAFGRPGRPANNPNRQPTQQEIDNVAMLGFSQEIARGAIQMANFDINQAIELILSNELGVIQFIDRQRQQEAQQQQQNQRQELERVMKASLGIDINEQEKEKQEQEVVTPSITVEDFQKLFDSYKLKLAQTLLELGSDTVIDCQTALQILKKLNLNLTKGQLLEIVIQKIIIWDDCSKKAFQLQVLLMQIQTERPDAIILPKVELILSLGNDLIKLATENPKANQALYFICLYLYHTLKSDDFTDQMQTFLLNVLDGPQDCGQKEIVSVIVCNNVNSLPQQQIQKIALKFVKKLDLQWALDSPISTQLEKLAIWSDTLAERLLKQFLSECYLAKLHIKQDQLKKQNKPLTELNDSLKFKYNDLVTELSLISKDIVLVKQVLQKNCKIYRNSTHTDVLCQLQDEKVKELISQSETAANEILSFRSAYTKFDPFIDIQRSSDVDTSEINEYERQTIAIIFNKILCALEEGKGQNQKLAEKALLKFRIVARFIMINSTNLNLLKTLIPNDKPIQEWFIDELCAPCMIFQNAEKPDELQLKPYPNFQKQLISLLTLVATSKLSTNYEEFKNKYLLRVKFLKQAIQTISANKELITIENKSKALAGLEVIRTLITSQNQYEFNRVVCQQQDFFDSIETLVLQTKFVRLVEELMHQLQIDETKPQNERDIFIACIVDILQTICEYIELLRAEEKQNKNTRKNKVNQAAEVKVEEVKVADEPMIEENQPVIVEPVQIVDAQVIQIVQGEHTGSEDQSEDGNDDGDDDDDDQDDGDQNQDEEMDVDGEGENDDDEYYDDEEDEEEKEQVVQREGQAQNDILRRPVLNRQPEHRRNHPFAIPDFQNYRARHEQRGAGEQAFDENWTVQEQYIRALINSISDHQEPKDGITKLSKIEIKRQQNMIENSQLTQKFDILKHLDFKQTTQLLQKNYQKFEQQSLSQKAKPVRVLTRVDSSQNGRRQNPYSFIHQIGNGGLFGPDGAQGLESMQERLRRLEEFMMMQRGEGLDEEDFMFGPPRELFGMENIRRQEEERIDLVNIDYNHNRNAQNQASTSLIALREQILQQLNQEGAVQTLVVQPEIRFDAMDSSEEPSSNQESRNQDGSQNIVMQQPIQQPPPILGDLLPSMDSIDLRQIGLARRASVQNIDQVQENQINQENQRQEQVRDSFEIEQIASASDQEMAQPQIQSLNMSEIVGQPNVQIVRQPSQNDQQPQIDQLLQQVDNLMGLSSPNVEMVQHQEEEEKQPVQQQLQQPPAQQVEPVAEEPFTYGFPNSVLLEHDIDPDILNDLPEDVRVELLSTVNWQPPQNNIQPPAQVQQVQQPAQENAQPNAAQQEEAKDDLGIDQEFLANLPEDIRQEILMNQRMLNRNLGRNSSQAQPVRQPEAMDVASIIATVNDPSLRREMILGLEESQIATLPPNLRAEAVQLRQQMNEERLRQRRDMEMLFQRQQRDQDAGLGRGMFHQAAIFGDRGELNPDVMMRRFMDERGLPNDRDLERRDGRDALPNEVFYYYNCISQPLDTSNLSQIETKLAESEEIVPSFLRILSQVEQQLEIQDKKQPSEVLRFNLLPTLNSLMTLHKQDGTLQNKQNVVNALQQELFELFLNVNSTNSVTVTSTISKVLFKISVLRLLIHLNKKNAIHLIRDFFFNSNEVQNDEIQTQSNKNIVKTILQKLQDHQKYLVEKESESHLDRAFLRNLQLCLTDIFGEIDRVFEKSIKQKSNLSVTISEDTIMSITQVLEFSSTDKNLVESIGKALKSLAKGQKDNWTKIFTVCAAKLKHLQTEVIKNLKNIVPNEFDDEEMDEYSVPLISRELSLNFSLSQQQNSEMSPDKKPSSKVILAKSEVAKIESILRQSQGELKYLVNLVNVFNIIYKENIDNDLVQKDLKDEQLTLVKKSHLNVMNEILRHVNLSKSVKNQELLSMLKLHVNCIFEYYILELAEQRKKVVTGDKAEANDSIKMKPLQVQQSVQVSNRSKVTNYVFGDSEEYNTDNLYEFAKFCLNNKSMINELVSVKTSIQEQSLNFDNLVLYMPNILNFENKRVHFKKELDKMRREARRQRLGLVIKRADIFTDAYAQLNHKNALELQGNLHIDFAGERGQDAGGLTRDFFIELSRAMFNPNYSLFNLTSNGVTYYPNAQSYVNPEHLNFFKFIGRMIGKALFDGHLLECYFSKPLYKMMVGEDISFEDQQDLDNDYYRSCKWALENSVDDQELYFSVTTDYFGKIEEKELIPGGSNIKVDDQNKVDYFKKMGYYRMYDAIKPQIDAFLKGFHELIPKKLVKIFSFSELELLISGLPNFDLNDLRANTEYQGGYTEDSPQVKWLWQTLATCSKEDIGRFLQFVTGSSKIPLEGFKALQGMRGPQNFTIARVRDITRLPQGHTCYNQFDMPEYPTYELLNERVLYAIKETVGFGFG